MECDVDSDIVLPMTSVLKLDDMLYKLIASVLPHLIFPTAIEV